MAIRIVEEASSVNDMDGNICVESNHASGAGMTELLGPDCRRLALQYAASKGLASPGVNGQVLIEPVNAAGKIIESPTEKLAVYRAFVPVMRKMI